MTTTTFRFELQLRGSEGWNPATETGCTAETAQELIDLTDHLEDQWDDDGDGVYPWRIVDTTTGDVVWQHTSEPGPGAGASE